jgi:ribosome-binding factor A
MPSQRITRVNELIRREVGTALFRFVHDQNFDMSAVTVTRVTTNPNLRGATVYVSIRDHQDDRKAMMSLLRKHRTEFQEHIARHLTLKYTPRLRFQLDESIERGDRVLDVLARMDVDETTGEEGDAPGTPPVENEKT